MLIKLGLKALYKYLQEFRQAIENKDEFKVKVMSNRLVHLYVGLDFDLAKTQKEEKTKIIDNAA